MSVHSFWSDVRLVVRHALRSSGFSISVITVLALGIAISAAMFSIVHTVLLKPLPYVDPDQLVQLESITRTTGEKYASVSYADVMSLQDQAHSFESIGTYRFSLLNFGSEGRPEALYGLSVTWQLLPTLGVHPALGRWFESNEDRPGHTYEVILSDDFWRRSLHADPHIVGATIRLNNESYQVVGVMPPSFNFPVRLATNAHLPTTQMQFWKPLGADPSKEVHGNPHVAAIARLKKGISLKQAAAELDGLSRRLEQQFPQTNSGLGATAVSLFDASVSNVSSALVMLSAAIGLMLLIACSNLASLSLARGESRREESALRLALGASAWRMLRLVLTENLLLAAVGCGIGCGLSLFMLNLFLVLAPVNIPRMANATIDLSVIIFASSLALVLGSIVSIAPMLQLMRRDPRELLSGSLRGGVSRHRTPVRKVLMTAEVALAFLLVNGTGLLLRSFVKVTSVEMGFNPRGVAMSVISLPNVKYPNRNDKILFFDKLLHQMAAVPGVEAAAASLGLPVSGQYFDADVRVEGRSSGSSAPDLHTDLNEVSPNYFDVLNIPLRTGRKFAEQDTSNAPLVTIIDEQTAHRLWPHEDPIGKRISIEESGILVWREIVGIVGTTRNSSLDEPANPGVYVPLGQGARPPVFAIVRSTGVPQEVIRRLREVVSSVDPEQPVFLASSMPDLLADSLSNRHFMLILLASFGLGSLILASLGIFGVVSYAVAQRVREIGMRMALGAQRKHIVQMILTQILPLIGIGLGLGTAIFLASSRLLQSFFYEVTGHDPIVLVVVLMGLTLVCILAAYLPARHAASIDPMYALRLE